MTRRRPQLVHRCFREDSGQVLAFFAVALVALVGMTALVVDVGYAYYVKRSLQASADAAATAGALELPDAAAAESQAKAYGGSSKGKNRKGTVPEVTTTVTTRCLATAPCNPINAISVRESATVKTFFARVVGFDTFNVSARATACSPCGAQPLDVMLVVDRSASMCTTTTGADDPACTDLNNAKEGLRSFLQVLDPSADRVGLAVFPPVPDRNSVCARTEGRGVYDSPKSVYAVAPLSNDYLAGRALNASSSLVQTIACLSVGNGTSYATALEHAQAELEANGRPDAENVIVFLSDGGANYGPAYYGNSSPYRTQPCRQGIASAAALKAKGTTIYSIGYDIYGVFADYCTASDGSREVPSMATETVLGSIATSREHFFIQPTAGELKTIFTRIAVHLTGTRLVDDPED